MEEAAVRVVICVPLGTGSCEYRAQNWKIVRQYLETHHPDFPIFLGGSDREPFSPAQARNNAAKQAGDWDVAVFVDSDTFVHPDCLREAISVATTENRMVIAGDGKIYADQHSSRQYIDTGLFFPAPTDWPDTRRARTEYDPKSVYRDPCSGVVVVPRPAWEATGGYVDSLSGGDSFEDLVFWGCCEIFGGGMNRTAGVQLHLWHPVAQRYKGVNYRLYQQLNKARRHPNATAMARSLLTPFGHQPP